MARQDSPGHGAAVRARNAVEDALFALAQLPLDFDREGVRDRLLRVIEHAYAVLDSGPLARAHLDGLAEGATIADEVRAILTGAGDPERVPGLRELLDSLGMAEAALRAAHEAVAQIQLARREELYGTEQEKVPDVRPFRASVGVPELHAFPRRSLLPRVDVDRLEAPSVAAGEPPRVSRPRTLEELAAFQREAVSGELGKRLLAPELDEPPAEPDIPPLPPPYEPAVDEVEVLRRLARSYLEDIAGARSQRKPNALETWIDQGRFEQRLLDSVDAFASLGGAVLPLVSLFHAEAKAPDAGRAFAVALTLGGIEGSDTVGAAVMTLKQSSPEEHPGWIEGFWLAPSPAVDVAMADLCTSSRPELVALALDVLHARGRAPDDVIRALADHADAGIATRVARALATALPRQDAIEQLERICATTDDDYLFLAAVESLLRRGYGPAVDLLRHPIDTPTSDARRQRALSLLCLVGGASDLDRLLAAGNESPTARLLRGLGRYGHVESLSTLFSFLEHEDADVVAAAAEALDRITGAGLRETIEEPWEVELPPEAEAAGGIPVPLRKVERVATDPKRWSAWVHDKARHLDARLKTRGGMPFSPMQVVDELEAKSTPPDRREEAALELAVVTGIPSLFSPHDWVLRQKKHLAELKAHVLGMAFTPGTWAFGAAQRTSEITSTPARRSLVENSRTLMQAEHALGRSPPGFMTPSKAADTPLPSRASPPAPSGAQPDDAFAVTTAPMPPLVPKPALPFQPASMSSLLSPETRAQEDTGRSRPRVHSEPSMGDESAFPPSSGPVTEPTRSASSGTPAIPFKPPFEPAASTHTHPAAVEPTQPHPLITPMTAMDPAQTIAAPLGYSASAVLPFTKDPSGFGDLAQTLAAPLGAGSGEVLPFTKDRQAIGSAARSTSAPLGGSAGQALPPTKDPWRIGDAAETIAIPPGAVARDVVPFTNPSRPAIPRQFEARAELDATQSIDRGRLVYQDAVPFKNVAPEPPLREDPSGHHSAEAMKRIHAISLAQYAGICATLTASPERVVEIRTQYGLDAHAWTALHALWQDRFQRDPTLQPRWEALVEAALSRRSR